jgi:RNA recognition motif-containing protein
MGRRSGESLGFGFVRFAKEDDAARAILDMNGKIVQSKQLTVKYASPPKNRGPMTPSLTLYVKPLLPSFTEGVFISYFFLLVFCKAELRALFTPYGEITEVKILYDHETNLKRQVGFIRFAQMESSIKAQKVCLFKNHD